MIRKGWVIGIVFSLICITLILFALIPVAFMGADKQMQDNMQVTPEAVPLVITEPIQQKVPAPGFEECVAAGNPVMESYPRQCRTPDGKHFVEIIPGKEQCEIAGGLWGIWSNRSPATASCNPSTSDGGKECSDSSQCQSFCQAKEGAQIGIEDTGMCYEYEFAICMQEVRNGVVDAEWCQ